LVSRAGNGIDVAVIQKSEARRQKSILRKKLDRITGFLTIT
jgi:hypothetical protein